jgi:hypothetical protein
MLYPLALGTDDQLTVMLLDEVAVTFTFDGTVSFIHSSLSGISVQFQKSTACKQSAKIEIFDMFFTFIIIFLLLEDYMYRYS